MKVKIGLIIGIVLLLVGVLFWFSNYGFSTTCIKDLPPKPIFSNETGDYYIGQSTFKLNKYCTNKLNFIPFN